MAKLQSLAAALKPTGSLWKINDLPVFNVRISLRRVYTAVQFGCRIHCYRGDGKQHSESGSTCKLLLGCDSCHRVGGVADLNGAKAVGHERA